MEVKVNGKLVRPVKQEAFYRSKYIQVPFETADQVSLVVKYGEEVVY